MGQPTIYMVSTWTSFCRPPICLLRTFTFYWWANGMRCFVCLGPLPLVCAPPHTCLLPCLPITIVLTCTCTKTITCTSFSATLSVYLRWQTSKQLAQDSFLVFPHYCTSRPQVSFLLESNKWLQQPLQYLKKSYIHVAVLQVMKSTKAWEILLSIGVCQWRFSPCNHGCVFCQDINSFSIG